eukprot:4014766-Pleurochrysis_carterae.AAC.2
MARFPLLNHRTGPTVTIFPRPDPLHTVGTPTKPYRLSDSPKKRHRAISAGVTELVRKAYPLFESVQSAAMRKRKRILLLRTIHKHTKYCRVLHADTLWIDRKYGFDSSGLHDICVA